MGPAATAWRIRGRAPRAPHTAGRSPRAPSSHAAACTPGAAFEQDTLNASAARARRTPAAMAGSTASTAAPARSRASARSVCSRLASRDVSIMTGPAASVENTRAVGRRAQPPVEDHARERPLPVDVAAPSAADRRRAPCPSRRRSRRPRPARWCACRAAATDVSCVRGPGRRGNAPVEAGRGLEDDERPPLADRR